MLIERGQADAIRLVRSTVNPATGPTTASEPMETNATNTTGVPPMVFVDDEGLEEQFLTDSEDTPNFLETTANHVTTPVEAVHANQVTQQTQEEELDLQPSRGPREGSLVNTIDQFLDEITRTYFVHLTSKQTSAFLPVTEIYLDVQCCHWDG